MLSRRNKINFLLFLSLTILVFGFQNCTVGPSALISQSSLSTKLSGNGGGYEGKPTQMFYDFSPNFKCQGQPAPESVAELGDSGNVLYVNSRFSCANTPVSISPKQIISSPFQSEFIGIDFQLYKRYEEKPNGVPSQLAELLCRDDFDQPSFEFVAHFNSSSNQALGRLYTKDFVADDFSVSRVLSLNQVLYVSNGFRLKVDLRNPLLGSEKSPIHGEIVQSSLAGTKPGSVQCIIGGSLDTSGFVLKSIANQKVYGPEFNSKGEVTFFAPVEPPKSYNDPYHEFSNLFLVSRNGTVENLSRRVLGSEYNAKFRYSIDNPDLILFSAALPHETWPSLFVHNRVNDQTTKLTNLTASSSFFEAFSFQQPVSTSSGLLVFDTQYIDYVNDVRGLVGVKVFNSKTRQIQDIARIQMAQTTYAVDQSLDRMMIIWNRLDGVSNVLEVFDLNLNSSKKIKIQVEEDCKLSLPNLQELRKNGTVFTERGFVLAEQVCGVRPAEVVLLFLDTGIVQPTGLPGLVKWISKNDDWLIVANLENSKTMAYNLKNSQTWTIPYNYSYEGSEIGSIVSAQERLILQEEQFIVGLVKDQDVQKVYRFNFKNGQSDLLCENSNGRKLALGQFTNQNSFLLTTDANTHLFRLYFVKGKEDCVLINEFPSSFSTISKLVKSDIGFGIIMSRALSRSSPTSRPEALFVPVDGRPPLKFNEGEQGNWDMNIAPDRSTILLYSDQYKGQPALFHFEY